MFDNCIRCLRCLQGAVVHQYDMYIYLTVAVWVTDQLIHNIFSIVDLLLIAWLFGIIDTINIPIQHCNCVPISVPAPIDLYLACNSVDSFALCSKRVMYTLSDYRLF